MKNGRAEVSPGFWHYCVLTPRGRSGIATIAMRGADVRARLSSQFWPASGRDLAKYAIGSAVYGRFQSTDAGAEDVIVGILSSDESEIHCHGGPAAVAATCEALERAGGDELAQHQWAIQGANDRIVADALIALANANTERAAAMLLDQYRGALGRELLEIKTLLARGDAGAASRQISGLLLRADIGLHLTRPWKVVLTGRPNVGKSSLMNAMLGYERSIVWHQPGTTRDVLTATTAIDGWLVELSDVAGLRSSNDCLEAAGVARAEQELTAADLVVFVADLTDGWDAPFYEDIGQRLIAAGIARPPILVHNKCDLEKPATAIRPAGINTSAVTAAGLAQLCVAISESLVGFIPPAESAIPFTAHQIDHLHQAAAALDCGEISAARNHISAICH